MDKDNNLFLNKENKTDVIELEESDNENYEQIILDDEDDEDGENSSSLSSNNFNTIIKKDKIINNGNSYEHKGQINQQQKKILSFEESIDNLKDNFKKLFNNENEKISQSYILDNKEFRETFNTNKNMQLIFKFTDIVKEIYENQLQAQTIEKNCDINRIIDIYVNKIRKMAHKRRIIVKDYKKLIYVIGVEMQINKIETQAKEFVVKKRTQTFQGNKKLKNNEDECYLMEINNNKKKKKIFYDLGEVTSSLIMLVQNLEKNAAFKSK